MCVNSVHIIRTSKCKKPICSAVDRESQSRPARKLSLGEHLQIRGCTWLLRCLVHATLHLCWINKVIPKMGDVFQEGNLESQPDMVKKNQVLMHLSHVANVRHHGKIEDLCKETDGQKLADACDSRTIDLDERQRLGLHEVLKQNTVCNMLSGRDLGWTHRA